MDDSFACQARCLLRRHSPSATYLSAPVSIFKAYDIRGLYGDEIDGDVAYEVGRAFVRVLGGDNPRVGLGRDMRLTAPELAARYRDGMVDEGAHVVDAGMVGTEMLYWLVGSQALDGGLMCTASHNPKAYTGAKLVERGAVALSGDGGIGEIRRLIEAGPRRCPGRRQRRGRRRLRGLPGRRPEVHRPGEDQAAEGRRRRWQRHGRARWPGRCSNGSASTSSPPTGSPTASSPTTSRTRCSRRTAASSSTRCAPRGADLGIAWDGDADRCFFIDDTGRFVDGDFMTALLAESILEKQPGADILYDVRASRAVPDLVERLGGTAHVNRVGHAFFKLRMRDEGGAFGGEVSGHYYFRDFYNADSGTIPALLILELLSAHEAKLSELLAPLRARYFISGEINSEVADTDAKMAEIERRYADGEITKLDGISVDYDDWHFNVRPSNTEPLLRLNLESLVSSRTWSAGATRCSTSSGHDRRHPLPADPHAVRGGARQLLPDRGRPADARRHRPQLRARRSTSSSGRCASTAGGSRTCSGSSSPTSTSTTWACSASSPAARAPRWCALDLLAPVLEEFGAHAERDDELAEALMLRHGIPRDVVTALRAVSRSFRGWGGSAPVDRRLADGEELEFAGRTLQALHRPGHSPSDTLFWDAERRVLIGGDHLIGHISSNPLISRPLGGRSGEPGDGRPRALMIYMRSLRETREMPVDVVLPGHGEPVTEHAKLIDERFALHERRAAKIGGLIAERPLTAYEIAQSLWGNVAVTQAFLTLSEVLGHVDLLIERGEIRESEIGGVIRYEAA